MWKNMEKWLITNKLRYAFFSFPLLSLLVFFHLARHTFATLALTAGVDIYTTSQLLGHANIRHTQRYAQIINSKKDHAVSLLDDAFIQ